VYKGQGQIPRELITRQYKEFLVDGEQLKSPIPSTFAIQRPNYPY